MMKAPIVALAATAAGFAAASAYLYGEISVERVRTQAEVAARSKHEARSRQLHQSVVLTDDNPRSEASVLPISDPVESWRFAPSQEEAPNLSAQTKRPNIAPDVMLTNAPQTAKATFVSVDELAKSTADADSRSAAPRLARRRMRERATLPESSGH